MLASVLLVAVLATLPGAGEPGRPALRPTAIELATAMVPCIAEAATYPVEAHGTVAWATISEAGISTLSLARREPWSPDERDVAMLAFWLDDDPIQPPMIMLFLLEKRMYPYEMRQARIACFTAHYRRLLEPSTG